MTVPAGLSLISSALPQAGGLDTLEYPVGDETVYQFVLGSQGYAGTDSAFGSWAGAAPSVAVAEAFFVNNGGDSKTWTRTFKIN